MSSHKRRRIAFSQNFLRFQSIARRVVRKSTIGHRDLVLEIGTGTGILTLELARRAGRVVSLEKDPRCAERSRQRLKGARNVEVVEGDFLEFPLPTGSYKIFANIPFNSTAAIIERLTTADNPPVDSWLLVQREAAERYIGSPNTTLVSTLLAPWYELEIVHRFRRVDFAPPPRVDTVLLRIRWRDEPMIRKRDAAVYRDFVSHGFTSWQPNVRRALRRVFREPEWREMESFGLELGVQPSQMPVADWLSLFEFFTQRIPKGRRLVVRGAYGRLKSQQEKLTKSHRTRTRRT